MRLSLPGSVAPAIIALLCACGERERTEKDAGDPTAADSTAVTAKPLPIDSALGNVELLRRFRADIATPPSALSGGARSRDELVRRFVRALETSDTAAINDMLLRRAEFAYLVYPTARLSQSPYDLDPQMMWRQMIEGGEKGIERALRNHGGRPFGFAGYDCPAPSTEGANSLWGACTLRRRQTAGEPARIRLFGSIIERDGTFKFVSYANDL